MTRGTWKMCSNCSLGWWAQPVSRQWPPEKWLYHPLPLTVPKPFGLLGKKPGIWWFHFLSFGVLHSVKRGVMRIFELSNWTWGSSLWHIPNDLLYLSWCSGWTVDPLSLILIAEIRSRVLFALPSGLSSCDGCVTKKRTLYDPIIWASFIAS